MIISTNKDYSKANFIVAYLVIQAVNLFVKIYLGEFAGWSVLSKGILACFLFVALLGFKFDELFKLLTIEILVGILFLLTIVVGEPSKTFSSIVFNAIFVYIPLAFSVKYTEDIGVILNKVYMFSIPVSFLLTYLLLNISKVYDKGYLMSGGYALCLQILFILDHFFEKRKIYDLLLGVAFLLVIIISGARGSILVVLLYIGLKVLFSKELSGIKRISIIILLVAVGLTFTVAFDKVINLILYVSEYFGISSRTVRLLLSNEIMSDSGRAGYYIYYWGKAKQNPLFGWGLAGGWTYDTGSYPHNLFLEFLVSFGLPAGFLLSILFIIVICRTYFKLEGAEYRLFLILLSFCFTLMFSNSFVMFPEFYMLVALMSRTSAIKFKVGLNE